MTVALEDLALCYTLPAGEAAKTVSPSAVTVTKIAVNFLIARSFLCTLS